MNESYYLIVGFIVGYLIGRKMGVWSTRMLNPEQAEKKKQNLKKILSGFGMDDEITNDKVERMLDVSDATAERYLNELEKQGKLRQVGSTGKYVIYKRV